ncbi:MFS transporter [Kitasatospora aureofaciens]|uniref:MFS transporter n=1 Tax=Kitasatospora aureofaciens TaxID=1894 RepID=UPI00210B867D|nr:MFS transporter [Kitasatospora aureofaciens]
MTTDTAVAPAQSSPVRMTGRQLTVLVVLLASQFMMAADFSILNVTLPKVGVDLGFTAGNLQWITTMFALCAAGCTLVFGRVGDYLGRRRIFVAGMLVLSVASVIGGIATSPTLLLVARTLQGLATAAITPAAMALLTTAFTEPALRTKALGLNGVMMSSGFTVGSILGGVLTELLSWRWAFFINIPVAVAAVIVVPIVVEESRAESRNRLDLPGALLITAGLFSGIYGITRAAESGLDAPAVGTLLAAVVLLAVFWVVESRTEDALVPVRILRLPDIALSNLGALFIFGGETAMIFFTGLYVQNVLDYSSLAAGLALLGVGAGQILGGTIGPKIVGKVSPRVLLGAALAGQGLFMLPMVWMTDAPVWLVPVVAAQFVNGVFSMLAMLSFMVIATSAVDTSMQGMATGMATQAQQVGIAIGIPLLSAVFAASIGDGGGAADELSGIHLALTVDAGLLVVAGALLWAALRRRGATTD